MKQYDDCVLCDLYKEHGKLRIVAEIVGCSDETVRRALIKYGVPRIIHSIRKPRRSQTPDLEEKQKILAEYYGTDKTINDLADEFHRAQYTISKIIYQDGHGIKVCEQNSSKISNEQLINEVASGLNCSEIAHKYGMSPERVYRRARDIGLSINDTLSGGHWIRRATHYGCKAFDVSINLKAVITKYDGICQICGKPTDITDIANGHIRKKYPTVDHIIPLSKGGTHTWDNIQLAHMGCNSGKKDKLVSR